MQRHIECDVAVVGGGAAGIAAAIGASRAGARTVLIERNPYFCFQDVFPIFSSLFEEHYLLILHLF